MSNHKLISLAGELIIGMKIYFYFYGFELKEYITTKLVAKIEIITRGVYTMLTHINEKKKHFPLQSGYLNIGSLKSSLNNTVF